MPIKFRIHSKIDLAKCRKIFKEHEKMDVPVVITLKQKVFGPLPATYGLRWTGEKDFVLSRWAFTNRRYSPSSYEQKIELLGKIEGTSDEPQFVIQTKNGEWKKMGCFVIFVFVGVSAFVGFMGLFAINKTGLRSWMFAEILPLLLSLVFILSFFMNMFLCLRFFKRLVNPKDQQLSGVISSK